MDRKTEAREKTVTKDEVRELLETAAAKLAAHEERALRMRHGAGAAPATVLTRKGEGHPEAQEELLALELQAFRELKARAAAARPAAATENRTKDKIVRALRRKK